jgi:hypothetical protein
LVIGFLVAIMASVDPYTRGGLRGILGWGTGIALGALFIHGSRVIRPHLQANRLNDNLDDPRRPILYLRSFAVDTVEFAADGNPDDGERVSWMNPDTWSAETAICSVMNRHVGPVVALGHPSDRVPRSGAVRFYVSDMSWQTVVDECFSMCKFLIIRPGTSQGLEWELRRIAERNLLPKTVFALIDEAGFPFGAEAYERFRASVESLIGVGLPAGGWNSWFIVFDSASKARLIRSRKPWWRESELYRKARELAKILQDDVRLDDEDLSVVRQNSVRSSSG